MITDHRNRLREIRTFRQLVAHLRDELGWPIGADDFEDLTFEYTPEELGIDAKNAAKIQEIKRLRPLSPRQPWGIFFVKFEPRRLPVVALRRILGQVALKKRASANSAERQAWAADDLLFVSNYGEGDERQIAFAHFSQPADRNDLPTLKVLGWDNRDTLLHLDAVARELTKKLAWPDDVSDVEAWREQWRTAFTLRHREVITTSKQLSIRLAELARAIRDRIKTALAIETERGPLTKLMKAFQQALVHDLDADGFADMYAQTIAYGLLSARIADPHRKTADDFAGHMRTNPFLRELMETFLQVGGRRGKAGGPGIDFDELGVSEVVELLDDANMEAVVRDFGDRNPQEDPVIHFYELFLKEYDAKKRMQRGVFYTPRPVVSYIVRSVDELLRTEFGLADGLADTTTWGEMAKHHKDLMTPDSVSPERAFVQILDPATGTGTFLVEAIDLIHKTLAAKWKAQGHDEKKLEALWNEYVPKYLLPRLHGYELLMAPYAIAHLKIGLKLYETGYRFGSDERARIYLTNALEPAIDFSGRFEFAIPALAHEAQAVNEIKRRQRFTVVVGNPPYAGISSNMSEPIMSLVEPYKSINGVSLGERKIWAQDDYKKFLRFSQLRVADTGSGVIGFITNHGFISEPTSRGMRHSLLETFPRVSVLDLHGSLKKREVCPDGSPDKNVFDIEPGVAISLLRRGGVMGQAVTHGELWGLRDAKYNYLLRHTMRSTNSAPVSPSAEFYLLAPQREETKAEFSELVSVTDIFEMGSNGIQTSRDHVVYGFSAEECRRVIEEFRSTEKALPTKELREKYWPGKRVASYDPGDTRGWRVPTARGELRRDKDWESGFRRALYRPFDFRTLFYSQSMIDWPRTEVMSQMLRPNVSLCVGRAGSAADNQEWNIVFVTNSVADMNLFYRGGNVNYPLLFANPSGGLDLEHETHPNFKAAFLKSLSRALSVPHSRDSGVPQSVKPEDILHYVYAVLYSPSYRSRYAEFLKIDFPRIPLPGSGDLFRGLARLGGELVALHLMESPKLDHFITTYTGPKNPEVGRVGWSDGTVWLDAAATKKGQPAKPGTIGFHGVLEAVWNFHIGGYQVCHKWLSDRKSRTLSKDDLAHYQKIVVALTETIRIMQEIDEVIEQYGGWPGAFQTGEAKAQTAEVIPFWPRIVEPKPEERYVTCVPLVPLKAAASAFGAQQHVEDDGFEWVAVESRHRLRPGMFVAQVVGKSMEPAIPDGAYCLFRAPVEGTRQGKTVLVQLRNATDPETGHRYTIKRYESEKAKHGDSWRHARITLKPVNPDFEPIVLTGADEGQLEVVAELIEVLWGQA